MSNPVLPLENIGTPVPMERVEKEIAQQLRAAQGDNEDVPVQRVRMSNLVIYCDCADSAIQMAASVSDVVESHPARALLLVAEPNEPAADITASVRVQCRALGRRQQACTEQVLLRGKGHSVHRLPFAVRSLLIGDLPTNLWWASTTPPPLAGELLFDLSESAQQIIYDSVGWTDPPRGVVATTSWLESVERVSAGRWRVASDLNWRRLKYWRRLLNESISDHSAPGTASAIRRVVVEHGPHAVVQGYLLVSWLAHRLGWSVRAGKVSGGTETTWRFITQQDEAQVTVRRLPEGDAELRSVTVSGTIGGTAATLRIEAQEGVRLSATLEGIDAAPRTLTVPPQSSAELIARQLSDRERDPVFHQSMAVAHVLARSVLS